jgi:hypothetical protein
MQLVTADDILPFLDNEKDTEAVRAKIDACEALAQAQAENYAMTSFKDYTPDTVPADIKAALIKWSVAEFIASYSNTNYLEGDGNYTDRASRLRKEAQEVLARYRPVLAL